MEKSIESILSSELKATPSQVMAAIRLLDSGATVPFIARYRKEATGGLSDTHLRLLSDRLEYLRELELSRQTILQSVQEQGKLTDSLKQSLLNAQTKSALDDLYLPFKPKRGTKAQAARESGLAPLAEKLLAYPESKPEIEALAFVNADKNVLDIMSALNGAKEILMESFCENAFLLGRFREHFWKTAWIVSVKAAKDDAPPTPEALKFKDYFDFRQTLHNIPSHRVLAIFRGRQEGFLKLHLKSQTEIENPENIDKDYEYVQALQKFFKIEQKKRPCDSWLIDVARSAWKIKMRVKIELDALSTLKKNADEEAIKVFAENLKNLLLSAPAGTRTTLGLDPGFRTGTKAAVVDKSGKILETTTLFPHPPHGNEVGSIQTLKNLCQKHRVEIIAIGNGTASRETDILVKKFLSLSPDLGVQSIVVSEAGASVYSASELGSQEMPDLDVSIRGAVSIARRLQDPLAELVKIDPKSIGVGQYQHDVHQIKLEKSLRGVVEDCVNSVGADLNTASPSLLSYVSGLTQKTAEKIVQYRQEKGLFKNRLELLKVPGFGAKIFEQSAGFLRILGGENPLDASAVHPESYPIVEKILNTHTKQIKDVLSNRVFIQSIQAESFVDDQFGLPTIQDILMELEKPGRDPRPEFKTAVFKDHIREMKDLKADMQLEGVVTNVSNFGAFVDIGVHQDGLVHISEITDEFIKNPHEVLKTGQIVQVRVLEIDLIRKRISLSMRSSKPASVGKR